VALSGRGEIYSFSVVRQAPDGYADLAPYPVALVRLAEGPLAAAQLTNCAEEELAIGQSCPTLTRPSLGLRPASSGVPIRPLRPSRAPAGK
jgi:uncharacterized protein